MWGRNRSTHVMWLSLAMLGACATRPQQPTHYGTLQDYLVANDRDIAGFYPRSDPDKIMQCYAEAMTRKIPAGIQPDLLAIANKMGSGTSLTDSESALKTNWLDNRPRFDGSMLRVASQQARDVHYEMAMICAPEMLKK